MSDELKMHPLVQKMAEQIHDPIPGDDKSNINNYIFDLELPNETPGAIVMKTYALENIGQMALRYDAEFLMICGVLPHIKKCLYNPNDQVIAATARACSFIAQSGGAQALLDEGFSLIFMSIATDLNRKFYVRDACTRAFGWLHVMREIESKH
jgi:hypothetical protein